MKHLLFTAFYDHMGDSYAMTLHSHLYFISRHMTGGQSVKAVMEKPQNHEIIKV